MNSLRSSVMLVVNSISRVKKEAFYFRFKPFSFLILKEISWLSNSKQFSTRTTACLELSVKFIQIWMECKVYWLWNMLRSMVVCSQYSIFRFCFEFYAVFLWRNFKTKKAHFQTSARWKTLVSLTELFVCISIDRNKNTVKDTSIIAIG